MIEKKKLKMSTEITKLKTLKEVFEYIHEKHPGWIINMYDGYSEDYLQLDANWKNICQTFKCKPQRIIIIERLELDDHYSFAELLTQTGFLVRTKYEFMPCAKCNLILPTEEIYKKLKESNKIVPEDWSPCCIKCL